MTDIGIICVVTNGAMGAHILNEFDKDADNFIQIVVNIGVIKLNIIDAEQGRGIVLIMPMA